MDRETETKIAVEFFPYAISGCSGVKLPTPGSALAVHPLTALRDCLTQITIMKCNGILSARHACLMPDLTSVASCLLQEQVTAKVQLQDSSLAH